MDYKICNCASFSVYGGNSSTVHVTSLLVLERLHCLVNHLFQSLDTESSIKCWHEAIYVAH